METDLLEERLVAHEAYCVVEVHRLHSRKRGRPDRRGGGPRSQELPVDFSHVDGLAEDKAGRMLSPLMLLDFETDRSQTIPLRGHPEFTLRDEANAITAHVFRNGFLEDLHSSLPSPLATNPRFARITDPEMKKLMIESSAKLAHWLCLREMFLEEKPEAYYQLLRVVEFRASRNWEREAQRCEVSAPEYKQVCASCNYPLHPEWRCCPVCEKPV